MRRRYRKFVAKLLAGAIRQQIAAQEQIAGAMPGSYCDELGKLNLAIANMTIAIALALDPEPQRF